MIATDHAELKQLTLFAGLPEDELEYISAFIRRATLGPDSLLVSALLPGEAVYWILDGSVKVQVMSEDGRELTLALLGPGDLVGELVLVAGRRNAASVVTREETSVLWLDRRDFIRCLDVSPALCRNLASELSERLRAADERLQAFATLDVTGRVALQILELAERYGSPVPGEGIRISIPVTQGEIGEMVAATRERVNQIMVRLRRDGVFSVDAKHHLIVSRPEVLAELGHF
jgi:CRP/FNR family transcriptional regulator/CRP/FNR family cyclic AMP-dependent transcriptional regulator